LIINQPDWEESKLINHVGGIDNQSTRLGRIKLINHLGGIDNHSTLLEELNRSTFNKEKF